MWEGREQVPESNLLGCANYGIAVVSTDDGGARVVYLVGGESLPIFILAVFAKNEKANLSAAERNALGRMVGDMIENYRKQP